MKKAVGIDLGGTNIKGVILAENGEILNSISLPTQDIGDTSWRENVRNVVLELQREQDMPIGLSAPGLANKDNTCISFLPDRLLGLENFHWTEFLGRPTKVLNDAHAATVAEHQFGVAKEFKDFILLTLGTGVGGGIVLNNHLHQGKFQMAGHIGHIPTQANKDEQSILGMPGSLEYAIGNYSVSKRSFGKYSNTDNLVEAYNLHEPLATLVWLQSIKELASALAGLIHVFSPQAIVLSGGLSLAGDALFSPLEAYLELFEFKPSGQKTPILKSKYLELSGAIGAASFVL